MITARGRLDHDCNMYLAIFAAVLVACIYLVCHRQLRTSAAPLRRKKIKQDDDALPPLSVIATWPHPNYTDPPTRGPELFITEVTTLSVALVCLALRLYVRVYQLRKAWWDDWVMVAAGVCCAATTVDVILATKFYGWDRHVWDVPYWMLVEGRKVSAAGQAFLSICASRSGGTPFLRLTWATIVVNSVQMLAFFVLLWAQCSYWNLSRTESDCISEVPGLLSQTILTVLIDFTVYILPMPTLYRLSLPLHQRLGLMVLFGLGAVVVAAGCMRTYWVYHVELGTYDVTWEGYQLWIWAAVEANLGVICGCAPILRSLVSDGGEKYLRTQANKDSAGGNWSGRTSTANNHLHNAGGWLFSTAAAPLGGGQRKRGGGLTAVVKERVRRWAPRRRAWWSGGPTSK
ncbi:hypothetical protein PG997_000088 [Apiospora hydei]|uniref:Rhodopsin domain-containing protein n=1 Tax=Apiospora hydei TaxID=1337664 RepID=A0ABR1X9W8_9PEZI